MPRDRKAERVQLVSKETQDALVPPVKSVPRAKMEMTAEQALQAAPDPKVEQVVLDSLDLREELEEPAPLVCQVMTALTEELVQQETLA